MKREMKSSRKRSTIRVILVLLMAVLLICLFPATQIRAYATTSADLSISENGIRFICEREDFSSTCYNDTTQSSIGYGTKCTGSTVQPHAAGLHSITEAEAKRVMLSQIEKTYAPNVRKQTTGLSMNQNQFDALVSLCYNCGGGTTIIAKSPLVKYLKGELTEAEAREAYAKYYIRTGGKVSQGLINRRKMEADLFFKDSGTSTNVYSFNYNANGGSMTADNPFQVKYGQSFTVLNTTCSRSGHTFAGWNVKRNNDNTWFVAGVGWCSESAIQANGYAKKVYSNNTSLTLDDSWIRGISGNGSYTFYAVWGQNRETRILRWFSEGGNSDEIPTITSGTTQKTYYYWYKLFDYYTGDLLDSYSSNPYNVSINIYYSDGSEYASYPNIYQNAENWIRFTPQRADTYKFEVVLSGSWTGTYTNYLTIGYDAILTPSTDAVLLNLDGTNTSTLQFSLSGGYPGKMGSYLNFDNTIIQASNGTWNNQTYSVTLKGLKVGTTDLTFTLCEDYTGNRNVVDSITVPVTVTANQYTVTFDANGGSNAPTSQTAYAGQSITIPSEPPTGKSYTVIFDGNEGQVSESSKVYPQSFLCWNAKRDGTGAKYYAGNALVGTDDLTLYAQWENPTLGFVEATRTGYVFAGWYDSKEVDVQGLPTGHCYYTSSSISSDLHLYAMWSSSKTMLFGDYNLNGELEFRDVTGFNAYRIRLTDDESSYDCELAFRGDVNADGVVDMDDIMMINSVRNNEITYASLPAVQQFKNLTVNQKPKTTYSYGESFNSTGLSVSANYTTGITHVIDKNLDVTGFDPYKIGTQTVTVSYYQFTTTMQVTVAAPVFTVFFDGNGGAVETSAKAVTYGKAIGSLPTLVRTGYSFLGWSYNQESNSYITSSTVYSYLSNKTLYAQWSQNQYTVTYNANGGTGAPSSESVYYGMDTEVVSNVLPRRVGYSFLGYALSAASTEPVYYPGETVTITENVALYAVWRAAEALSVDQLVYGELMFAGQERIYKFVPLQDGKYRITSPSSAKLMLTFPYGNATLEQTYQSDTSSEVWVQLTAGKTYYLMVSAAELESCEYYLSVEKLSTVRKGDVNGDGTVDAADAGLISRYDAGFITLTDEQLLVGDVNGDGEVDAADAGLISRYDAGFIVELER